MTLSRKIVLRNLVLLGGLLLLGATALGGMFALWGSVLVASDEYIELHQVEVVLRGVNEAQSLLRLNNGWSPEALDRLISTQVDLERFYELQQQKMEGSPRHESAEDAAIHDSLVDLRALIDRQQEGAGAPDAEKRLQVIAERFAGLAHDADRLVASTQRRAGRDLRRATLGVAGVFLLIMGVTTVVSVLQYRGIIRPLGSLRYAVRRIASGRFEQRVQVSGDEEFAALAGDFNQMAGQLDDLYRTLERKVDQKSRELVQSERLASVGFLAAGVAHEINNPLNIMSGYAELSLKRLQDDASAAAVEDARQSLQIIRDEAFRCRGITERLLTLARDRGRNDGAVHLPAVIDDVVAMIRVHNLYKDRSIKVEVDQAKDLLVRGREAELKQVLLNLVVNALDASTGSAGQVSISAGSAGERVVLEVIDNGCGMTPAVLSQVFEPFFSARHDGYHGIGLGLSITRAIIEGCGGEIHAGSDGPGLGSRFSVLLRRAEAVPQRDAPEEVTA